MRHYPTISARPRMEQIKQVVNEIIKQAWLAKDDFPEAINWADLKCTDVESVMSLHNDSFYRAVIEEASPDCPKFIQFIRGQLKERGFGEVEIVTEW